ncbi:desiccation-related protein pcc13-62 [Phtheirospermum japonicum]|uniref:Desiccation-related protein pcc13-62 n=1 Tax=Phtheirospermum japonicum TaxID=374723 RepID=A0A830DA30_9LAMI|nr:desiccation-related protein pcc13-62 [Phtheirospermum japonicum]
MGGPPPFGAQKANLLRIKDIIEQFGYQEVGHLRDALGGDGIKDEGIRVDPKQGAEGRIAGNVLAGNNQSVAYDRSPAETLRIVYASGNESVPGGFFPWWSLWEYSQIISISLKHELCYVASTD